MLQERKQLLIGIAKADSNHVRFVIIIGFKKAFDMTFLQIALKNFIQMVSVA